jgi:hypothetical protein
MSSSRKTSCIVTTKTNILNIVCYGQRIRTLRKVEQKYLECFEILCWKRLEKISWNDHVKNEVALQRVNEERNTLHTTERRKSNWIGQILRRKFLLKYSSAGKIEGSI